MFYSRHKRHREYTLSGRIESIIREGIFHWIENHDYRNPADSIGTFAKALGVTEYEVAEYMRYNMDIKYCTLRRLLRIRDAVIFLLIFPEKSLRAIGKMVGFADPSNFRKQFREYTNHSPSHWRRRIIMKRQAARPTIAEHRPVTPTLRFWLPFYPK